MQTGDPGQRPQPGQSYEERAAALRRLVGSNMALLDAHADGWKRTREEALKDLEVINRQIDALTANGEPPEAEAERYEELCKLRAEMQQVEIIAGEYIDRCSMVDTGDDERRTGTGNEEGDGPSNPDVEAERRSIFAAGDKLPPNGA